MRDMLSEHLDQGGIGLSLGLAYPPGCFGTLDELLPLAEVIRDRELIVSAHMRNEGTWLLEALEEFIALADRTGCRLQISHLKAMWQKNWDKLEPALAFIDERIRNGADVSADRYTYTASSTGLDHLFPSKWFDGGNERALERLKDDEERAGLAKEIYARYGDDIFDHVQVVFAPDAPQLKEYFGMRVSEMAEKMGKPVFDAYTDFLIETELHAAAVYHGMSEDNLATILSQPYVSAGSDARYRSRDGITSQGVPHPRAYGTFSRYLGRYVRERKVLSLEEALYRITAFPAERFHIRERGYLKKGYKADITVFDPDTIIDHATFPEPHQYSTGVEYLFVNGRLVIDKGELTGVMAGRVLR
jgi:N-acyl-D-amino-acid deacylase